MRHFFTVRLLPILLTVLLLLPTLPAAAESPADRFTDLKHDWSYEPITWCVENGLMNGMSETLFAPKGTVTRAQFVTVLCRIAEQFGYNMNGYVCADRLTDIKSSDWYAKSVTWGYKNGIVKGISAHSFAPNATLTRQDMATLLCRFLENYLLYDLDPYGAERFDDYKKIASYAKDAVMKLASAGLLRGSAGCFDPKNTTTRAEMAAVLQRLFSYVEAQGIEPFARLKYGINVWTFCGGCYFSNTRIPDESIAIEEYIRTLWEGGFDHVRLQFCPVLASQYGITVADTYYRDEDGGYHFRYCPDIFERTRIFCRVARSYGMSVVLDLHNYICYFNMALHHEEYMAEQRTYIEEALQKAKESGIEALLRDVQDDYDRFELLEQAFREEDPETVMQNLYTDGLSDPCPYNIAKFSRTTDLQSNLLDYVYAPNDELGPWQELWEDIAEEFKDLDDSVFFQLVNEQALSHEENMAAIRAIRSADGEYNKKRMIVCYTYCWEYYRTSTAQPIGEEREEWDFEEYGSDPNIMFDMHNYCPAAYVHANNNYVWLTEDDCEGNAQNRRLRDKNVNEIKWRMNAAKDLRERTGRYVWQGETGVYKTARNRDAYLDDFVDLCCEYNLPTCYWAATFFDPPKTEEEDPVFWFFYQGGNQWHEPTRYAIFN